jgi:hypothetical protein
MIYAAMMASLIVNTALFGVGAQWHHLADPDEVDYDDHLYEQFPNRRPEQNSPYETISNAVPYLPTDGFSVSNGSQLYLFNPAPSQVAHTHDVAPIGQSFPYPKDVERHMVTHTKEKGFPCSLRPHAVRKHRSGFEGQQFPCRFWMNNSAEHPKCKLGFAEKHRLFEHDRKVHSQYNCTKCITKFENENDWRVHIGSRHHCSNCSSCLSTKPEKQRHDCDASRKLPENFRDIWQYMYDRDFLDGIPHNPCKSYRACFRESNTD